MIKLPLVFFFFFSFNCFSQNLEGIWYGKITQKPGGFSDSYDFDLHLKKGRDIRGVSIAAIPGALDAKVGIRLVSAGDTIRFRELKNEVFENMMPEPFELCIKKLNVVYRKIGKKELLIGRWTGVSYEDGSTCPPGQVVLARSKTDLIDYIANLTLPASDSVRPSTGPAPNTINIPPFEITSVFKNTAVLNAIEIPVRNRTLTLSLRDYEKEDNDTVTVYLNRQILASKVKIGRKPITIKFELNPNYPVNEILLFAENLGGIPPNTSEIKIHDGKKIHRVFIESDMQKTASIHIKYTP